MKSILFCLVAVMLSSLCWAQKSYRVVEVKKEGDARVVYMVNDAEGVTAYKYYEGDILVETGLFKDGKRHGTWARFDNLGSKVAEANYENGVKQGTWTVWHPDGVMQFQILYRNNRVLSASQWDESGMLLATR